MLLCAEATEWNLDYYHGRHLCLLCYFTSKWLLCGKDRVILRKQTDGQGRCQTNNPVLAQCSCALNFLHFKDKHDCFAWHPRAYTPLYACAAKHCSNLHPCTSLMSSRSPGIRSNYCIIRLRVFVWAKQSRPDYEFLLRFFCCCCFLFGVGDNFIALTGLGG